MLECFPFVFWETILPVCPCFRHTGMNSPCCGPGVVRVQKPVHTDVYQWPDTAARSSDPACCSHCAAGATGLKMTFPRLPASQMLLGRPWTSSCGEKVQEGRAILLLEASPVVVVVAVPRDVALLALVMAAVAALAGVVVAVAPSLWSSRGQHLVRCQ